MRHRFITIGLLLALSSLPAWSQRDTGRQDTPPLNPSINPDGIIRADTNKPGLLSPGIAFSVWGRGFGPAAGCRGAAPELCGVQVLLDGRPVEIQFTSDVLINARVPEAVPPQALSRLTVISGGRPSDPVEVRRLPEPATIGLEGDARVDGPVWIHVDLPHSLQIRYPARAIPWEFGCEAFEVRKDGKPLDPIPVRMPSGVANGPTCPEGSPAARTNRLPLHLQYNFDEPGVYEVRFSRYGDFMRRPGDIRIQSAWTPIEVLAAADRILTPPPQDPGAVVTNFLPNLLALRNEETLWILLGYLHDPNSFVRSYAADALYYWPDSVIVPKLMQTLRSYGPVPEVIGRLGSHAAELLDAALPSLMSGNPVLMQGAIAVAQNALSDTSPIGPDVRARLEQTLIAVASNPGPMDASTFSELVSLIARIGGTQVHELLWSFADRHVAVPVALDAIAAEKDAKDLPRLAAYLISTPADDPSGQALVAIPNVLRAQFGADGLPWLRAVMEKAPSQVLRIACAKELMFANDSSGFAFALDAVGQNRPWKAQIVAWVNGQFPESRNKTDAQLIGFLRERSGAVPTK